MALFILYSLSPSANSQQTNKQIKPQYGLYYSTVCCPHIDIVLSFAGQWP